MVVVDVVVPRGRGRGRSDQSATATTHVYVYGHVYGHDPLRLSRDCGVGATSARSRYSSYLSMPWRL